MIRILQCTPTLNTGGIENMLMKLYGGVDREHFSFDFMAVTSDAPYDYEETITERGGRIFRIPKRSESLPGHYLAIYRLLKHSDFDVIHFHTGNAFFCASEVLAARLAGKKKTVVYCHSTGDWRLQGKKQRLSYRFLSAIARRYLRRAVTIRAACSRPAAEWLYGESKGIRIFPLPIICADYRPDPTARESFRARYGFVGRRIYAHTGRFGEEKNHRFLLEVFRNISERDPDAVLFLMGDGPLKKPMEDYVRELGLGDRVIFWGNVRDVHEKLNAADVFLLPSRYEGYPTVVLEAQAAGLPCFVSNSVTDEIRVTDLVRQLPLSAGAEAWAEEIARTTLPTETEKCRYNEEVAGRYDLAHVVRELEEMYRGM